MDGKQARWLRKLAYGKDGATRLRLFHVREGTVWTCTP